MRKSVFVFSETKYSTTPFPLPLLPEVMIIQSTSLAAVHPQPSGASTPTLPAPASDVNVSSLEDMKSSSHIVVGVVVVVVVVVGVVVVGGVVVGGVVGVVVVGGACVTVKVSPAIVIVPVLLLVLVLDETEYPTVPLPLPLLPEVIVIQLSSLLSASQSQPSDAITSTVPVPPVESKVLLVGMME